MIYAKIEKGTLITATRISDSAGSHNANAENPTIPIGWQLVESEAAADEIDNGFPVLSRRKLRLTLLGMGVTTATIVDVISQIANGAEREAAMIYWEDTPDFKRDHALVIAIGDALGMTDEQMDDAWMKAT